VSRSDLLIIVTSLMCMCGCAGNSSNMVNDNSLNIISSIGGTLDDQDKVYLVKILDASITGKGIQKIDNVFREIHNVFEKSKHPDEICVELLKYQLGSGPKEDVMEYLIGRGTSIVPLLKRQLNNPVRCYPKYKTICLDTETVYDTCKDIIKTISE